jgi:hypothetical protein
MGELEPGGFSNSGPGMRQDRRVEPEQAVRPEQIETDPAIWPSRGQADPA